MCDQRPHSRLALLLLLALIASCASPTYLSWRFETRGFLEGYAELSPGHEGELQRSYRAPGFVATEQTGYVVESPTIWRSDQAPLRGVSREALTSLAKELEDRIRARIGRHAVILHAPVDGSNRVQIALVEDAKAWVVADTYTTASRGRTSRAFRRAHPIDEKALSFASGARVEIKITDVTTGEIRFLGQSGPLLTGGAAGDPTEETVVIGFDRVAAELLRSIRRRDDPNPKPAARS